MNTKIVFVHGRNHIWRIPAEVQRSWLDALKWGLERAGHEPDEIRDEIRDEDVYLAFYGDVFRPEEADTRATEGGRAPKLLVESNMKGTEEQLARELVKAAERRGLIETEAGLERVEGLRKWLLRKLDSIPVANRLFLRAFVTDTARYLDDRKFRGRVMGEVGEVLRKLSGQKTLVIAHSMGTIVTYDLLNTNPDIHVDGLITLGSPLAIENGIYNRLLPEDEKDHPFPEGVETWWNFYDKDDVVAFEQDLGTKFKRENGTPVQSVEVSNRPDDAHDIQDYLSAKATAKRIWELSFGGER